MFDEKVINWLLEDDNPAVAYRTKTELLGQSASKSAVLDWIKNFIPTDWHTVSGLWYVYYITAFAECGLTSQDIEREQIEKAFSVLQHQFDCGCGDFMLLRALVKLGFADEPVVADIINNFKVHMLPDGGFLCLHRLSKLNYTPKSCYKANLHALFFLAECRKKGIRIEGSERLIDYFLNRDLFYRSDEHRLVLDSREGWRTIDTFYPFEVMRVGLQNVLEAFCALGYGDDERLNEAWDLLKTQQDETGKFILKGTLTKSYLPKEHVGKPSKWVTFYALLA
ncbi:MAG TPA: hypothetical protein PLV03_03600, partial [Clostridiales bacterium]|nr:hypothetical protein [Clostridiales bacterium]